MNGEIQFRTVEELYNRVLPALYSKVKEVRRAGLELVNEKDIWNFLVETEWKKRNNLELHELISDILNVENYKLKDYINKKMQILRDNNEEDINMF